MIPLPSVISTKPNPIAPIKPIYDESKRVVNEANELKELMWSVGLGGMTLTRDETGVVLGIMWSSHGIQRYTRSRVQRLIDVGLLAVLPTPKNDALTVAVMVTVKLEQEFALLENYRSL